MSVVVHFILAALATGNSFKLSLLSLVRFSVFSLSLFSDMYIVNTCFLALAFFYIQRKF